MFDVRSSLLLHHTVSLVPFSPEGSTEVSHRHVKPTQIKPCTHTRPPPARVAVRAGAAVVFLGGGGGRDGPFVRRSPTVFSKNKPERLLIRARLLFVLN